MDVIRGLLQSWTTNAKQTLHDFVVDTLHRCSTLTTTGILRGQIISLELESEFPNSEFPQNNVAALQKLIADYDSISDSAIMKDLHRSIAVTQDDPATGIRLARQINAAIDQIRTKDAIGGRILVLANLLHVYQQDTIARHRQWSSRPIDPQTDRVLTSAIRELQGTEPEMFWAHISADDLERLAAFLRVDKADVPDTMHAYLVSAFNSLFVESE